MSHRVAAVVFIGQTITSGRRIMGCAQSAPDEPATKGDSTRARRLTEYLIAAGETPPQRDLVPPAGSADVAASLQVGAATSTRASPELDIRGEDRRPASPAGGHASARTSGRHVAESVVSRVTSWMSAVERPADGDPTLDVTMCTHHSEYALPGAVVTSFDTDEG